MRCRGQVTPDVAAARLRGLRRRGPRRARCPRSTPTCSAPSTASRPSTRGASACGSCPTGRSSTGAARPARDAADRRASAAARARRARRPRRAEAGRVRRRLRLRLRARCSPALGPALGGVRPDVRALRRHAPRRAPARAAVPLHVARHADRRRRSAACRPGAQRRGRVRRARRRLVLRRRTAPRRCRSACSRGRAAAVRLARLATSAARSRPTTDLLFRNLDGTGTLLAEIVARHAARCARAAKLTSISQVGGMIIEAFEVECFLGERARLRDEHRVRLLPEGGASRTRSGSRRPTRSARALDRAVDGRDRPRRRGPRATSTARRGCPAPMLLMLDRVTGFWPEGGSKRARLRCAPRRTSTRASGSSRRTSSRTRCSRARSASRRCCQLLQFCMLERGMADGHRRRRASSR